MRKLIAAMNLTLDGYCDHTAGIANEETHEHYNELLRSADTMLFGRTTYQLMESYWPSIVGNPTGVKATDDFGLLIDNISKVVFSRTLDHVSWKNTELKRDIFKAEILDLKKREGKNILVGSPSIIVALANLNLIDEYQLNFQPIILGEGLPLFKNISNRVDLKFLRTKTFACGPVLHYYEPINQS